MRRGRRLCAPITLHHGVNESKMFLLSATNVFWLLFIFSPKSFDDKSALFRADYFGGYLVFQSRYSPLYEIQKAVFTRLLRCYIQLFRKVLSFATHTKNKQTFGRNSDFSGLTSRVLIICFLSFACFRMKAKMVLFGRPLKYVTFISKC